MRNTEINRVPMIVERRYSDYAGRILFEEKNTILIDSRTFMRDLMFGDNTIVTDCRFGNLNLSFEDDLNITPDPVKPTDHSLVHETFIRPVGNQVKTTIADGERPAVLCV